MNAHFGQHKHLEMKNTTKIVLDNGLKVVLKEIHHAPIVSFWIWYQVGSRLEKPGITGITHWVEHMQFKGTPSHSAREMEWKIARHGGVWNAFTHIDWTAYYETIVADQVETAIALEADRMVNSLFAENDVEAERNVILSEKDSRENEPFHRLNNAVTSASFIHHPYRNEVIGSYDDLKSIQRDDLYNYYRKYYQPENATISVVGNFKTSRMIHQIRHYFENIPSPVPVKDHVEIEPTLSIPKEVLLTGPGDTTFLQIAYRSPAANDPDFFALLILDSYLTGPASLNMFGAGGTSNRTSRLYRKIINKRLAESLSGGLQATIDPYIYDLSFTLNQRQNPQAVIDTFDHEIERIRNEGISHKDIARAIKQARAMFAFSSENVTNQAFWLGYSESIASVAWFYEYVERLSAVRPKDIQQVAEKYLKTTNRVVGMYLPGINENNEK